MASNSISFRGTNSGVQVGINHGPIYPSIERLETPPAPLLICPFRRDHDFVDRGALLEQIYQKGCAPAARIALVGLGGVGKSQLAIECCYRIEERYPQTWVFWIHAANAERFEKSCWDIANRVKVPGRNDPRANVFQLIHTWLSDKRNGKWVVILDNVDDSRFLHETQAGRNGQQGRGTSTGDSLLESLPVTSSGSIIITSRSRDAVGSIVEPNDMIAIGPMNESDAAELFAKKLGEPFTEDADQLMRELDYMPLAIVQAAAHIRHRAPRVSVSQYLRKFQQNDQERTSLLNHDEGQLRRDKEAKNSILVTWQISFDHIRRNHPAAADVLSLMCLFDRQGIPETLLRYHKQDTNDDHNQSSNKSYELPTTHQKSPSPSKEDDASTSLFKAGSASGTDSDLLFVHSTDSEFEESISTLRDYSLISIVINDTAFEMHRLVQLAMRLWLKAHGQLEQWKKCFTDILLLNFPTEHWEKWDVCQLLLPHILSAVTQPPTEERTLGKWAQLVQATANFTMAKGYFARTEELATLALKTRAILFGSQDKRTIDSLALVGQATRHQGRWKNAEHIHDQVIKAYTQISGPENPATLTGMNDLASAYWEQGRWKDAEEIQLQVLEMQKRILGPEHHDTLFSMKGLALNYRDQGRWNEAGKVQSQVLEACKRILGPKHPKTLSATSNLAMTYESQGRWNEAKEMRFQVLEDYKRVLGLEHPVTLVSMSNLASTYSHQGRWNEAEELELHVLRERKRILGPEHPDTLTSMGNLASTYSHQGRWNEAEELDSHVLRERKRVLGPEHPMTLVSMSNLASTYSNQGRWNEVEELELQVLRESKRILGPEHPDTLISMGNLASTYSHQGRWNEAEELESHVLRERKRILGPEHPDTLESIQNYAHTLWASDQDSSAIVLMADCVRLRTQILGPEHYKTISATRILDDWREINEISCTGAIESSSETSVEASFEASSENEQQKSQNTISKEDSQTSRRHKRSIFSRLFRRS